MTNVQITHEPKLTPPTHLTSGEVEAVVAAANELGASNQLRLQRIAAQGMPVQIDGASLVNAALIELLIAAGVEISHVELHLKTQQMAAEFIDTVEEQLAGLVLARPQIIIPGQR